VERCSLDLRYPEEPYSVLLITQIQRCKYEFQIESKLELRARGCSYDVYGVLTSEFSRSKTPDTCFKVDVTGIPDWT
jgi:hypothetical protein